MGSELSGLHKDGVVILDFGSQYTQLIARRIRDNNVHSIILPYDFSSKMINKYNVGGFILSGGPSSVYDINSPDLDESILEIKSVDMEAADGSTDHVNIPKLIGRPIRRDLT